MTWEALDYFCLTQAQITNCFCHIYDEHGNFVKTTRANSSYIRDFPVLGKHLKRFLEQGVSPNYKVEPFPFCVGYIKVKEPNCHVLIGPMKIGECTDDDIRNTINSYSIPALWFDKVSEFLRSLPIVELLQVYSALAFFDAALNNNISYESDILADISASQKNEDYLLQVKIARKLNDEIFQSQHVSHEFENKMLYYVKNGMTEELSNLHYTQYGGRIGKLGNDNMRSIKNSLIISDALCARAAIDGGLQPETAYTISEQYVQAIENAETIKSLYSISKSIKMDYCSRVKALLAEPKTNPLITKALKIISQNIYAKITAQEIAAQLKISPAYLAKKFKEHTGCSVPEYIMQQKIKEAKRLLRFTDKSLIEISTLLCFATQSHFQNNFKKIRGMTPNEYRTMYKRH